MRMRRLDIQRSSQWLRATLAGLLLAFALNTVAHASHRHDLAGSASTAHSITCGYCTTFGGVADLPVRVPIFRLDLRTELALFHPDPPALIARPVSTAQPRAPPHH